MMSIGFLAELITAYQSREDDSYSIVEQTPEPAPRPLSVWPAPVPIEVLALFPEGPPLRFVWRGAEWRVAAWWGPERIETGWWRGDDVRRDYYQVETASGERFWLFRRMPDERWFLHGVFA